MDREETKQTKVVSNMDRGIVVTSILPVLVDTVDARIVSHLARSDNPNITWVVWRLARSDTPSIVVTPCAPADQS